MADYDNTNSGALFKNKKREHDKQPTHTGSINIEGKDYWLSAWVKTVGPNGQNPGDRFFSLAVNAKDGSSSSQSSKEVFEGSDNYDDDVPF